jgi:hypothetical protein
MATVFDGFGGAAYAVDNLDMSVEFVFGFQIPSALRFVLQQYDLLPRPAGVGYAYTETAGGALMIDDDSVLIDGDPILFS